MNRQNLKRIKNLPSRVGGLVMVNIYLPLHKHTHTHTDTCSLLALSSSLVTSKRSSMSISTSGISSSWKHNQGAVISQNWIHLNTFKKKKHAFTSCADKNQSKIMCKRQCSSVSGAVLSVCGCSPSPARLHSRRSWIPPVHGVQSMPGAADAQGEDRAPRSNSHILPVLHYPKFCAGSYPLERQSPRITLFWKQALNSLMLRDLSHYPLRYNSNIKKVISLSHSVCVRVCVWYISKDSAWLAWSLSWYSDTKQGGWEDNLLSALKLWDFVFFL